MEGLKHFILPALAALLLHGLLISVSLPIRKSPAPVLSGKLIRVEIESLSPKSGAPAKQVEEPGAEPLPKPSPQEAVAPKKTTEKKLSIIRRQEKLRFEPEPAASRKEVRPAPTERVPEQPVTEDAARSSAVSRKVAAGTGNEKNAVTEGGPPAPVYRKALPLYRQNRQPDYPLMARRRGYAGTVMLSVRVGLEGRVSEIRVKHSSGHISLDRAALRSVKKWMFTPAMEGGRNVAMWVDIPIEFQLN